MKVKIIKVSSAAILLGALRVNVRAVTRHSAVTDCSGFIKYHYYNCFTFAGKQSVIIFNYRCVFKSIFFSLNTFQQHFRVRNQASQTYLTTTFLLRTLKEIISQFT